MRGVNRLLQVMGLSARDVEVKTSTHALHVAEDGATAYLVGTAPAADQNNPWTLAAVRVDAGATRGLVDTLVLGTSEAAGDLWAGSLPIGEWMPAMVEVAPTWDGSLYASLLGAELASQETAAVAAALGGTLDGSIVGEPYTDKALGPFDATNFVSFDYIGESESELRTLGLQFTPDYQATGPHKLLGRGASNVAGLTLSLNAAGNNIWAFTGPGGVAITGTQIVGLSITDQVQHWLFFRYCFDASEDCSVYHFLAGSDAAAANDSTAVAQTHDRTESSTQLGEDYTGTPWGGSVEQVALWDRYLTVDEMGDVSAAGSPSLEGGSPYATTSGLALDRARGGSVTLLLVRRRQP